VRVFSHRQEIIFILFSHIIIIIFRFLFVVSQKCSWPEEFPLWLFYVLVSQHKKQYRIIHPVLIMSVEQLTLYFWAQIHRRS